jgi:hypothetical protein
MQYLLESLFDKALFVIYGFFLFLPVLAYCDDKIVQTSKQKQFSDHVAQIIVNSGKYSEINKQFYVK